MVDISHTTGDPSIQDASIMDFLRALGTDAGAVGNKIGGLFRGDGTRAVNKGISSVPSAPVEPPSPYEGIGAHPDDFAMSGIGRSPQDNMPNVPAKAPVTRRPISPPMPRVPTDAEQMRRSVLNATDAEQMAGVRSTTAPDPSSIMEGATSSSDSTIPPLLALFWQMMQRNPNQVSPRYKPIPGVNQRRAY